MKEGSSEYAAIEPALPMDVNLLDAVRKPDTKFFTAPEKSGKRIVGAWKSVPKMLFTLFRVL